MKQYTEQEFSALSDDEYNRTVAEAMGKCWHEYKVNFYKGDRDNRENYKCWKCGKINDAPYYSTPMNINYLNSAEGCVAMMEWCGKNIERFMIQSDIRQKFWRAGQQEKGTTWFEWIVFSKTLEDINTALAIAILKSKGVVE